MSYDLNKLCEKCEVKIPDDFGNLLCPECYDKEIVENERLKQQEIEMKELELKQNEVPTYCVNGITDPNYQENPEAEDKDQIMFNLTQFVKSGIFLWHPTRDMYTFIKNWCMDKALQHPQYPKFIWKPRIVDVGCGSGTGSNIMSQEADFVWGIDKNQKSVDFAKQMFERVKNNIYYSSQVSFDTLDVMDFTREVMKFDVVTAIEIVEHVFDYKKFLTSLIQKFDTRDNNWPTTYFISTPNRNNKGISKDKPKNIYHCREWSEIEFIRVLKEFFNNVEILNSLGEPVGDKNDHTPILAKCSGAKI